MTISLDSIIEFLSGRFTLIKHALISYQNFFVFITIIIVVKNSILLLITSKNIENLFKRNMSLWQLIMLL